MALLDEVATYLIAQGVGSSGSTANWTVNKGFLPASPDKAIGVFETGGFRNDGHTDATVDRPTFQLLVRGDAFGYSTARTKLTAARTALEGIGNENMGGRRYVHVQAQHEALSLGQDENSRPKLVMNFTALRSRTS